jgi:hypothetical protein
MSKIMNFRAKDDNSLEIDFGALDLSTPHLTLPSSIGNGMQFVSKFMSSKLSDKPESMKPLLDYLLALNYRGEVKRSVIHITGIIIIHKIKRNKLIELIYPSNHAEADG